MHGCADLLSASAREISGLERPAPSELGYLPPNESALPPSDQFMELEESASDEPLNGKPPQASYCPTIAIDETFWLGNPPRLCVMPKTGASRWRSFARPCNCRYIS